MILLRFLEFLGFNPANLINLNKIMVQIFIYFCPQISFP